MAFIISLFIGCVLIAVANVLEARKNQAYITWFELGLLVLNLLLMPLGLCFTLIPQGTLDAAEAAAGTTVPAGAAVTGLSFVVMALWGAIFSRPSARRWAAKWLPIDPNSPVHTLALIMSGYVMASAIPTFSLSGLEQLVDTAAPATSLDIFIQFAAFVLIAFLGVGYLTRRETPALLERLGLARPTKQQLLIGTRWMILLVIFQWIVGVIAQLLDPQQIEVVDQIGLVFLKDFDTVWEWALLALGAGIGEELLFRGALQPVLGLEFTAVVFAFAHVQYGFTAVTLAVFVIGIVLGRIRRQSNTTVAIYVHAGYNFILGMISLLAPYLESLLSK